MVKFFLLVLISLSSSSLFAADSCAQFAGNYKVSTSGCVAIHNGSVSKDDTYRGMGISFVEASQLLSMTYKTSSGQFTVNYIADGKEHEGDVMNTGKTYVASCDGDTIFTSREGMLKNPLLTVLFFTEDSLHFEEAVDGSDFTRVCNFERI